MIYFDNAATTYPKPPEVAEAVREAVLRYGANPGRSGHALAMESAERVFECREMLAEFVGLDDPARIVFTRGCTEALNTVIKGVTRPGDHVLISCLEHNAVARPVYALTERGRMSYTVVPVYPGEPERTLNAFDRAFRPNTRLCVCTMGSNVFGVVPPCRELGELCRRRGVLFCVDAAQSAGLLPFDFCWDYACFAGHKGLYGPTGVGILAVRSDCVPRPLTEGGTGSLSASLRMPEELPEALESGTLNTVGILGLTAGLRFVCCETPAGLYRRELRLTRLLYDCLSGRKGITLYTPVPLEGRSLPVLSLNLTGADSEETVSRLSDAGFALRGGLHCAPLAHRMFRTGGTVRFSPGAFSTESETEQFADAVLRLCRGR